MDISKEHEVKLFLLFCNVAYFFSILSILLYEPYANESSQICPFLAVRSQFDSDHNQNRRLSSRSYSHESVIFLYFLDSYLLSYGEFAVFKFKCTRLRYAQTAAVENKHCTIILR